MRRFRRPVLGAVLLTLALTAVACGGSGEDEEANGGNPPAEEPKGEVTVGSDSFAEAQIVGEMYAQVLENAGYTVNRQLDLGSREVRLPAMESGEVDIAPEYLATLLSVVDPEQTPSTDAAEAAGQLAEPLEAMGLAVLEPSGVVDTNAFVTTPEHITEYDLTTVGDLAPVAGDLILGGPLECPKRPFCIPGLKKVYGVEFGDFKPLEYGPTITALAGGEIDVGLLFSTDGTIAEQGFIVLEDDLQLQAADNITPLIRAELLEDTELTSLLNEVSAALETGAITELNRRANVDVEDVADLAKEFLEDAGLL